VKLSKIIFSLLFLFQIFINASSSLANEQRSIIPDFESSTPLAGKIWDLNNRHFITEGLLLTEVAKSDWVLLGENHESETHHAIEQNLIEAISKAGKLGNVAFEMANHKQQEALDKQLSNPDATADSLNWSSGWPWDWYGEVVKTALVEAQRVIATDLTRDQQMHAYKDSRIELPTGPYREFMDEILYESHCGKLPKSQLSNMLRVQLARDRAMQSALINNSTDKLDIFIAGTMHTRYDTGIPLLGEFNSKTILMVSAGPEMDPGKYIPESYQDNPIADYIIFTPETEPVDHCGKI
jgi:uncharacterized iron-regulated protein